MDRSNFYKMERKGMVYMSKVYRRSIDGEFNEPDHKIHSRHDRKYVKNRICDEIKKETGDTFFTSNTFDVTDDIYVAVAWVKRDSKRYDVLKKLGFTEKDEEES